MASSVSSERAFSQGGITISKRRSCLKGDIVEALQFIRCAIHTDLLFREPGPSSTLESIVEDGEESWDKSEDEEGWEGLLIEEDDDDVALMSDTN